MVLRSEHEQSARRVDVAVGSLGHRGFVGSEDRVAIGPPRIEAGRVRFRERPVGERCRSHSSGSVRMELLGTVRRMSDFNQAIMELGATICLPAEPLCLLCPLAPHCGAHSGSGASEKPAPRKKLKFTNVTGPLAIIRRGEKILLRRRANTGLLAGMWELPGGEKPSRYGILRTLRRHLHEIGPLSVVPLGIGEIRHSITYRRIRAPIFLFDLTVDDTIDLPAYNWRWVAPAALTRYPASSMTLKAARVLASYEKNAY